MGSISGLLWTRQWTFELRKRWRIYDQLRDYQLHKPSCIVSSEKYLDCKLGPPQGYWMRGLDMVVKIKIKPRKSWRFTDWLATIRSVPTGSIASAEPLARGFTGIKAPSDRVRFPIHKNLWNRQIMWREGVVLGHPQMAHRMQKLRGCFPQVLDCVITNCGSTHLLT